MARIVGSCVRASTKGLSSKASWVKTDCTAKKAQRNKWSAATCHVKLQLLLLEGSDLPQQAES